MWSSISILAQESYHYALSHEMTQVTCVKHSTGVFFYLRLID